MTPGSDMLKVIVGVAGSAAISFAIASPIVRKFGSKSLDDAKDQMASMKAEAKGLAVGQTPANETVKAAGEVKKVIFACDAGMGSSAMGATKFRNHLKGVRPDITVKNTSVDNIPGDCDIAVVQLVLADRARKAAPQAQLVTIDNFLADPALDQLYSQLTAKPEEKTAEAGDMEKQVEKSENAQEESGAGAVENAKKEVIIREGIRLGQSPVTKEEAIAAAGKLLNELGYVDASYADAMQERERLTTTYMGMGVAIPHGTTQAKDTVKKTGIVFLQYPEGVDFGDEKAQLVFGIAGIGDEHLDLLSKLCELLEDEEKLEELKQTKDVDWVLEQLA